MKAAVRSDKFGEVSGSEIEYVGGAWPEVGSDEALYEGKLSTWLCASRSAWYSASFSLSFSFLLDLLLNSEGMFEILCDGSPAPQKW